MSNQQQAMSSNAESVFREAVKYVLSDWPSLNLAIDNGMGGESAHDKRSWMCRVVADALIKDRYLDLVDYISQIVDNEFDTVLEDGSVEYNAIWIMRFLRDCSQGKEQDVMDAITRASLSKLTVQQEAKLGPRPVEVHSGDSTSSSDDGDES